MLNAISFMSMLNYTTPDVDQKHRRKLLGRRYGIIPLPFRPRHKKNKKNRIKNDKQCSIVFHKTCLNIYNQ